MNENIFIATIIMVSVCILVAPWIKLPKKLDPNAGKVFVFGKWWHDPKTCKHKTDNSVLEWKKQGVNSYGEPYIQYECPLCGSLIVRNFLLPGNCAQTNKQNHDKKV